MGISLMLVGLGYIRINALSGSVLVVLRLGRLFGSGVSGYFLSPEIMLRLIPLRVGLMFGL